MAYKRISRREFLKAMATASAISIGSGVAGCTGLFPAAGNASEEATPSVERSARIAVRDCMGAKAGERVLIVTDTLRKDLGLPLYDAAVSLGCRTSYIEMELLSRSGEEPPEDVARAMSEADVVIMATKYSLSHTEARRNACNRGARIGSMPIQSEDGELVKRVFATGGMTADISRMNKAMADLRDRLKTAREMRINTAVGTDMTFEITPGFWIRDLGLATSSGGFTNVPGGELLTVPANANGVIVIDGSFGDYGLLKSPLELTIEDCYCTSARGDHAEELNALFAEIGRDARNVGELGIGMNPAAQLCGIILEDEKALNTIHIALGDNASFGGNVHVPLHFDGIVTNPQVEADDKIIDINGYQ